eukprot:TRINITY_DN11291_c0_g1_i1.p1 TRINITY_DN11291_c0_g1~~TRINITY_DN11291_c0_g1_i1.p1  ORF type:complete len:367 (+),score=85.46 TRINITY_DN11291_c0_g1_i1:59-1159(+)
MAVTLTLAQLRGSRFLLLLLLCVGWWWWAKPGQGTAAAPQPAYGCEARAARGVHGVVIDAGSTGTRAHVFTFARQPSLELISEGFFTSAKALGKDGARAALGPLVVKILKGVPREAVPCTEVVIGATAGLRVLGHDVADALVEEAAGVLRKAGFPVLSASVLSGTDEGAYAWITVNYLTGALHDGAARVGILDGGGGSFQLVEEASPGDTPGDVVTVDLPMLSPRPVALRVHSALGYGLNAGLAKLQQPCGGFAACRAAGRAALAPVPFHARGGGRFYAFSYFHAYFGERTAGTTIGDLPALAEGLCAATPDRCAAAAYLAAVCDHLQLPAAAPLVIAKKIAHGRAGQPMETAWPLGAFLSRSARL